MTAWERTLWQRLRTNKTGFHFRRQHPIGPYVLDFYCHEARLCVELDSEAHVEFTADRDAERDLYLEQFGILTLRISNGEAGGLTGECVEKIRQLCRSRTGK